jgi:hypothetical protein
MNGCDPWECPACERAALVVEKSLVRGMRASRSAAKKSAKHGKAVAEAIGYAMRSPSDRERTRNVRLPRRNACSDRKP